MKKVSWKAIKMGWILAALFCITFIAGSYHSGFYVISLFSIMGVVNLAKFKLRCPHCNKREKLERLTRARKQEYHCSHCGKLIEVDMNA